MKEPLAFYGATALFYDGEMICHFQALAFLIWSDSKYYLDKEKLLCEALWNSEFGLKS